MYTVDIRREIHSVKNKKYFDLKRIQDNKYFLDENCLNFVLFGAVTK